MKAGSKIFFFFNRTNAYCTKNWSSHFHPRRQHDSTNFTFDWLIANATLTLAATLSHSSGFTDTFPRLRIAGVAMTPTFAKTVFAELAVRTCCKQATKEGRRGRVRHNDDGTQSA